MVKEKQVVMTTGRKCTASDIERARQLAARFGFNFKERSGSSVSSLAPHGEPVIVLGGNGFTLFFEGQTFRYHPGMGVNRLRMLRRGQSDWMIEAMGLKKGDCILDATLGIGSDLLVGSYVVGDSGKAVGVESQPLLAFIVSEGLRTYEHPVADVTRALRRIEVIHGSYQDVLPSQPTNSFDVVYFDPMFSDPVKESNHMIPIRLLANSEPLSQNWVDEAVRVARRRVVVKDRRDGPYVQSGWFDRVVGGTRSRITYCVIDVDQKGVNEHGG